MSTNYKFKCPVCGSDELVVDFRCTERCEIDYIHWEDGRPINFDTGETEDLFYDDEGEQYVCARCEKTWWDLSSVPITYLHDDDDDDDE